MTRCQAYGRLTGGRRPRQLGRSLVAVGRLPEVSRRTLAGRVAHCLASDLRFTRRRRKQGWCKEEGSILDRVGGLGDVIDGR